jgi:hypothetical protein
MRFPHGTVDRSVAVATFLGLVVAAEIDPDEPSLVAACDELALSQLLDIRVSAVNSALRRARARLRERLPSRKPAWPASVDASAAERDLLKKYVEARRIGGFSGFRIDHPCGRDLPHAARLRRG